jgi:DNA-binding transcriptional ArsR family regulator
MTTTPLDHLTRIHKALGHPVRLRILAMLRAGELCVCQINAVISLAPSTISAHLGDLRDAGLIAERKQGRWVHYRLAESGPTDATLTALWRTLGVDGQVADDAALLAAVTKLPAAAICRPEFDVAALRRRCCAGPSARKRARA